MNKEKVLSQGREASGKLLVELQVRKSTADGAGARLFYTELTTPFPGWEGEIRDLVLRKKLVSHGIVIRLGIHGLNMILYSAQESILSAKHIHRKRRGCLQRIPADADRCY